MSAARGAPVPAADAASAGLTFTGAGGTQRRPGRFDAAAAAVALAPDSTGVLILADG